MSLEQAGVTTFSDLASYGEQWAATPPGFETETQVPATSLFDVVWQPIANLGQAFGKTIGKPLQSAVGSTIEKLPDLLFALGAQKLGFYEQRENAGTTTQNTGSQQAGGLPINIIFGGTGGTTPTTNGTSPVQQVGVSSLVYVAIIALVVIMIFKAK